MSYSTCTIAVLLGYIYIYIAKFIGKISYYVILRVTRVLFYPDLLGPIYRKKSRIQDLSFLLPISFINFPPVWSISYRPIGPTVETRYIYGVLIAGP